MILEDSRGGVDLHLCELDLGQDQVPFINSI